MGGSPKPVAPTPPVTETTQEVVQAGRQRRRDIQKLKGFRDTLLAGNPENAGKSLLGGGE